MNVMQFDSPVSLRLGIEEIRIQHKVVNLGY